MDFPEIKFAVENEFKKLSAEKLTPWVFMNAGKMAPIEDFYGRTIKYRGVRFEGSPRQVFWGGFIDPFVEAIFVWAFEFAIDCVEKRNYDRRESILYTHQCLTHGLYSIYNRMQDIDRNLRGGGFPNQIAVRDISREIKEMETKLNEYKDSALAASRPNIDQPVVGPFSDAIEFKPGICGISLDLKKLWNWFKLRFGHS